MAKGQLNVVVKKRRATLVVEELAGVLVEAADAAATAAGILAVGSFLNAEV